MGATGRVGEVVAEELLRAGAGVRAIVREPLRAQSLKEQGAELVVADAGDAWTMTWACADVAAAFVLAPPVWDRPDPLRAAAALSQSLQFALLASGVPAVVVLSSIGAHLPSGTGIVAADRLLEAALWDCAPSVTFVRSAWFLEEWASAVWPARMHGVLPSMFVPVERAIPQISTVDVGRICADAMRCGPPRTHVVEAEGPRELSPSDAARVLTGVVGREVTAVALAEQVWVQTFLERGDSPLGAAARMETFHATNEGTLTFEGTHRRLRGRRTLEDVVCGPGPRTASPPTVSSQ
jgi:uncharacterized protein YbjT (DUF2867 family)